VLHSFQRLEGGGLKTQSLKKGEISKDWLLVDAKDVPLGRLATRVATYLRGKHKPAFTPHLDMGDNVIVINASQIRLTGMKLDQKTFLSYSGYYGGQKATSLRSLMATRPEWVLWHAVKGMLPKTRLGRRQLTHLRVYPGAEHPHQAQQPRPIVLS
jgi:large subunit ribosomal protein L13